MIENQPKPLENVETQNPEKKLQNETDINNEELVEWITAVSQIFKSQTKPEDIITNLTGFLAKLHSANSGISKEEQIYWGNTLSAARASVNRRDWESVRSDILIKCNEWLEKAESSNTELEKDFDYLFAKCCKKINEGSNGVIMLLDLETVPEAIRKSLKKFGLDVETMKSQHGVIKLLKVFRKGSIKDEYERQIRAYSTIESLADKSEVALIPKPYFFRNLLIHPPDTAQKDTPANKTFSLLTALGTVTQSTDPQKLEIDFMIMDYIPGKDLAHKMYEWILLHPTQSKRGLADQYKEIADRGNFFEVEKAALEMLNLPSPLPNDRVTTHDNAKKIHAYLKSSGFRLPPNVIKQIENTGKILRNKNCEPNESHERNIMITGEHPNNQQAWVIDFGKVSDESLAGLSELASVLKSMNSL